MKQSDRWKGEMPVYKNKVKSSVTINDDIDETSYGYFAIMKDFYKVCYPDTLYPLIYETDKYINKMTYNINLDCPAPEEVEILYPDGTVLVRTNNEYLFNHIRVQIAQNEYEGFKVRNSDGSEEVEISSKGKILPLWPKWLFNITDKQLSELFRIQNPKD